MVHLNNIRDYDLHNDLWLGVITKLFNKATEEQSVAIMASFMSAADEAKKKGYDPYSAGYTAAEEKASEFGLTVTGPELRTAYAEVLKTTLASISDKVVFSFPDCDLSDTVLADCEKVETIADVMGWFADGYAFPESEGPHVLVHDSDAAYANRIKNLATDSGDRDLADHTLVCVPSPYKNKPGTLIAGPQLLIVDPVTAYMLQSKHSANK